MQPRDAALSLSAVNTNKQQLAAPRFSAHERLTGEGKKVCIAYNTRTIRNRQPRGDPPAWKFVPNKSRPFLLSRETRESYPATFLERTALSFTGEQPTSVIKEDRFD